MTRKDKRSLILCMLLGDGNLHALKRSSGLYGFFTLHHSIKQADYQAWKAELVKAAFDRDVKVRPNTNNGSVQIQVCDKRLRSWYKFFYKDKKKDIPSMFKFIRHPELAVMVWLMDDGYVEPSFSLLSDGTRKNYGARFRLFTCDQTEEQNNAIIKWFEKEFNVSPKIKYSYNSKYKRHYPFLKFNQEESFKLWVMMREKALSIKSMQYKFRHIEELYQRRVIQRTPTVK